MTDLLSIKVELGERSYPVYVGNGVRDQIVRHIPGNCRRVAVVTQHSVPREYVPDVHDRAVEVFHIGEGEAAKSLSTVEELCRGFSRFGLGRNDMVVGVGGGQVTDVAGFAASVYHRGIAVAHVATTLLAMIDAAIGGKTGVNLPEGKNLVGTYWQPDAVACDTSTLATLPAAEIDCGQGEMAKYHFIARADLSVLPLDQRILECVRVKADIVASDEREAGRRAVLNYGHTMGHAIETASGYSIPHGVAVASGLLFAAHLAHVKGLVNAERVDEHYRVVRGVYGLAVPLPSGFSVDTALQLMQRDKKAVAGLTFVLDSDEGLIVSSGVAAEDVRLAFAQFTDRLSTTV